MTATDSWTGTFAADPIHSHFGFAVRYQGMSLYRGTLTDASAQLSDTDGELVLEGSARAESISITQPQFRAHVLGEEFFDAEHYPEVSFRSQQVTLHEDGAADVEGELTIKGVTQPVSAHGRHQPPVLDPYGKRRGAIELEAAINREAFGFSWNMALPSGATALAAEVTLTIALQLVGE